MARFNPARTIGFLGFLLVFFGGLTVTSASAHTARVTTISCNSTVACVREAMKEHTPPLTWRAARRLPLGEVLVINGTSLSLGKGDSFWRISATYMRSLNLDRERRESSALAAAAAEKQRADGYADGYAHGYKAAASAAQKATGATKRKILEQPGTIIAALALLVLAASLYLTRRAHGEEIKELNKTHVRNAEQLLGRERRDLNAQLKTQEEEHRHELDALRAREEELRREFDELKASRQIPRPGDLYQLIITGPNGVDRARLPVQITAWQMNGKGTELRARWPWLRSRKTFSLGAGPEQMLPDALEEIRDELFKRFEEFRDMTMVDPNVSWDFNSPDEIPDGWSSYTFSLTAAETPPLNSSLRKEKVEKTLET